MHVVSFVNLKCFAKLAFGKYREFYYCSQGNYLLNFRLCPHVIHLCLIMKTTTFFSFQSFLHLHIAFLIVSPVHTVYTVLTEHAQGPIPRRIQKNGIFTNFHSEECFGKFPLWTAFHNFLFRWPYSAYMRGWEANLQRKVCIFKGLK